MEGIVWRIGKNNLSIFYEMLYLGNIENRKLDYIDILANIYRSEHFLSCLLNLFNVGVIIYKVQNIQ